MKKTLLIVFAILFVATLVFADTQVKVATRSAFHKDRGTRIDIPVWQDTFEDGNIGWTLSPTGATNLWHIAEVTDAPSPIHAMINQNASGSYNPSMNNYLVSPIITLPESGVIKADFQMKGSFTDPNTFPNVDYWGWQITPNNGANWYYMSNPYGSATGFNYVFSDAPTEWQFVTEGYSGLDGLISDYAGLNVKFRILFHSDADTPVGPGVEIDDFTIYNSIYLAPPTNLTATIANPNVNLNWTAAATGVSPEYITSTNENWSSFVSDSDAYAMKITNPGATALQLHGVNFMLYRTESTPIDASPTIHVYADDAGLPGEELLSVSGITDIPNMDWKRVDITSHNIMIPASGSIFIGVSDVAAGDDTQGLLCDSTSTVPNSYALTEGSWDTLTNTYDGLSNCALSGTIWNIDPSAPVLTNYKVYRSIQPDANFEIIDTVDPAMETYTDANPVVGQMNYYRVTAVYGDYESDPSNTVTVNLIELLYTEFLNDDGDSNLGYAIGTSNSIAVKFVTNPPANHGTEIHYAKVFLATVGTGQLIVRVWNNDGANGLPGTQLLQFATPASNLVAGWNMVALPTSNIITDTDGIFYVGVLGFAGASQVGEDTDTNGSSWKRTGTTGSWTLVTDGNYMIRALVSFAVANDDQAGTVPIMSLANYPNPFNPSTSISFSIPKAGHADLKIYNVRGQLVRTLVHANLSVGSHTIVWDGTDEMGNGVVSGVYFAKLDANGKKLTQKMVLLK
jgi:hypothetical protein